MASLAQNFAYLAGRSVPTALALCYVLLGHGVPPLVRDYILADIGVNAAFGGVTRALYGIRPNRIDALMYEDKGIPSGELNYMARSFGSGYPGIRWNAGSSFLLGLRHAFTYSGTAKTIRAAGRAIHAAVPIPHF